MNRRQFVLMAVALAGEAQLVATMADTSQQPTLPQINGPSVELEQWLWSTGPAEFGPTIQALMKSTSTSPRLPPAR